jgi:hypothetical protein
MRFRLRLIALQVRRFLHSLDALFRGEKLQLAANLAL